jgi:hypothetical protein
LALAASSRPAGKQLRDYTLRLIAALIVVQMFEVKNFDLKKIVFSNRVFCT